MPVEAIHADVQFAVGKPASERLVPLEDARERLAPLELPRARRPERFVIAVCLFVDLGFRVCLRYEFGRGRKTALLDLECLDVTGVKLFLNAHLQIFTSDFGIYAPSQRVPAATLNA